MGGTVAVSEVIGGRAARRRSGMTQDSLASASATEYPAFMQFGPDSEFFDGFKWAIPRAFAAPLAACRFEQGDVLYDTPKAYEGEWASALKHIGHSVVVKRPLRGGSTKADGEQESMFADNWNSRVELSIRDFKRDEEREVTTTQGRLYWLLWKGDLASWETADVPLPMQAKESLKRLRDVGDAVRASIPIGKRQGGTYLVPYDTAEQRLWVKARAIHEALREFEVSCGLATAAEAGLPDAVSFAPTARIAWFALAKENRRQDVEQALKRHLHKPAKNKKTDKEIFSMDRHGHFEAAP